jgi:hypothetical protein
MRVSGITLAGDWTFGKGRANYKTASNAIRQNVVTRLRSFTNDWFLDVDAGIPWFDLLGNRNTERRILRAIERTVLQTEGVIQLTQLEIIRRDADRGVTIALRYIDVFETAVSDTMELPL